MNINICFTPIHDNIGYGLRALTMVVLMTAMVTMLCLPVISQGEEFDIPLGNSYKGHKCTMTVADFAVQVPGAPREIGNGLQEMLQTALFECNYFIVVDRMDPMGISAEQLLSDSFMADPEAILAQGQMDPAEVLVYGTLTALEGGGAGLRVKVPWVPLNLGGTYHEARATIDLRVVDAASGRVISVAQASGSAVSGRSAIGTSLGGLDLPVALEMFKNSPLELCIRDSIYRSVVTICKTIPPGYFRH